MYTPVFQEWIPVRFAYSSIVTHIHDAQVLMGVLLQIYACPIYETMDTAWGRKQEGTWSIFNFSERFVTRVIYMALTTFVAALLPFFVSATLYIANFVSSLSLPLFPPASNTFQSLGVPGVDVSSELADVAGTHIRQYLLV